MSATLAPTRHTLEIPARELQPGDRIVGDGVIPVMVEFVDPHPFRVGFMFVAYTFGAISGERCPASDEALVVQRLSQGSH